MPVYPLLRRTSHQSTQQQRAVHHIGTEVLVSSRRCPTHKFLYPTNVLGGRRKTLDSTSSFVQSRNASHRNLSLGRANSNRSSLEAETGGEFPSEPPGADGLRVSRLGGSGVQPAPA
ncbi:hypothetical protein OJAV_G00131900 [Oryzias javanicus]|uniref:Uncharacterized protein n=1 Tax=Oryzias javanicus TaxID=123683 RepID=A0A3S2PMQ6_ORYJA|nr:hypothetical protein OJAV_G00131900 [Oryzias javanicus]